MYVQTQKLTEHIEGLKSYLVLLQGALVLRSGWEHTGLCPTQKLTRSVSEHGGTGM